LQKAIELKPSYKEDAATDIDFDDINKNQTFQKLIQS
jgi:hypothetical protein